MARTASLTTTRRLFLGLAAITTAAGLALPAFSLANGFRAYSKEAFDAALKDTRPVIVHVHAVWCPVCKQQEAVFNELSKSPEFAKITAFTVDFDKDGDFKRMYTITNQSIVIVFKNGREVMRSAGETNRTKLAELVAIAAK